MIIVAKADKYTHDATILSIGLRTPGTTRVWKLWEFPDEGEMISDFMRYFLSIDDKIVVGFNILKFDIPLLLLKSRGLPEFEDFFRKINYANVIDLFVILTHQRGGVLKGLDFYCKEFGINADLVSGLELTRLYENKEYGRFEKHFMEKLEATAELSRRLRGHG